MNKTIEEVNLGFIEAFGQETFNEFETLTQLEPFVEMVAADLEVEPLSLAVEDIEEDSKLLYLPETGYGIIISKRCFKNRKETIKCILHEMRHYKQKLIIEKELPHPLKDLLKENLSNFYIPEDKTDNEQMCKYTLQPIELDAFAYTKYFFKKYLNQDLIIFHQTIEVLFDLYIEKYLK